MSSKYRMELEIGLNLQRAGQFQEAEAIYGRVVALAPNEAEGWHALGMSRLQQGDATNAIDAIARAISIDATQAAYFNNYGAALQGAKRCTDSLAAYRAALHIRPGYFDAQLNLVRALNQLKQPEAALPIARTAVSQFPESVELLQQAIRAAAESRSLDEAISWLEKLIALAKDPLQGIESSELADYLAKLGKLFAEKQLYNEAIERFIESLNLDSTRGETHYDLGLAFAARGDHRQARESIRIAHEREPERTAWELRRACITPAIYQSNAEIDQMRSGLEAWLEERLARKPKYVLADLLQGNFSPPYSLSYQGRDNRVLKEKFAAVCRPAIQRSRLTRSASGKIRVGFVCTPGHESGFERCRGPIIRQLDQKRFEVFLICGENAGTELTRRIGASGLHVVPLSNRFPECVRRIAEASLDILYYWEVGSDVLNYLLPFAKPARVQCTSWGTQITSGVSEIDFYLSSSLVELAEGDKFYSEKLWRLQSLPTFKQLPMIDPAQRGDFGLPKDAHLYLCPRALHTIHPDQDYLFAEILRRDPKGKLVLLDAPLPYAAEKLRDRFKSSMPDLHGRVIFLPHQSENNFLQLVALADVVLDTLHVSSGNTAYDVFAAGQTLVTLPGNTFLSRFATGCYRQMRLPHFSSASLDDYVATAIRLAQDDDFRDSRKKEIVAQRHALFDGAAVVFEHERFFESAGDAARQRS